MTDHDDATVDVAPVPSTTVSVNASTGAVATQRYLPSGAPRSVSGTPVTDRGWIGQTKDASTGLQYLNARYYDPTIGRFTATDPLADVSDPGTLDAYGYSRGSPVTLSDPTGLLNELGAGGGGSDPRVSNSSSTDVLRLISTEMRAMAATATSRHCEGSTTRVPGAARTLGTSAGYLT